MSQSPGTRTYRCSPCDVDWPSSPDYKERCPVCNGEVWPNHVPGPEAITVQQAVALVMRMKAERDQRVELEENINQRRQHLRIIAEARKVLKALPTAYRWNIPMEERCAEYDPDAGAAYDG